MQRDQIFRVIGLRVNGDRVVITKDTDRETAERIVRLMTGGSTFVDFSIDADGADEPPGVRETSTVQCAVGE